MAQASATDAGRAWIAGGRQARQEWLARALTEHCTERQRHTIVEALSLLDGLIGR